MCDLWRRIDELCLYGCRRVDGGCTLKPVGKEQLGVIFANGCQNERESDGVRMGVGRKAVGEGHVRLADIVSVQQGMRDEKERV